MRVVLLLLLAFVLGAAPAAARAATRTPVVYLVFDELAVASLMDRSQRIDPVRYPNFAALAGTSTWFRNATTVADGTGYAVPAALAGRLPRRGALPNRRDYPTSAFSVFAPTHRVLGSEPITTICCPSRPGATPAFARHAPTEGALRAGQQALFRAVGLSLLAERRESTLQAFIDALAKPPRRGKPVAHVAHILSPHIPWRFQPDGHEYAFFSPPIPGLVGDTYSRVGEQSDRAWARHLLQVGDMDRRIGLLVAKLKRLDLWDRALVLMTADHGVAFAAGGSRREITTANLGGIAGVPLFVKRPGQTRGRVVDAHVETIDALPTAAAALGLKRPPGADGRNVLRTRGRDGGRATVRIFRSTSVRGCCAQRRFPIARYLALRGAIVRRQAARFGSRAPWARLYEALGPRADLNGRALTDLRVGRRSGASFTLDTTPAIAAESGGISGTVRGLPSTATVAVVVGGVVRTTTRLYRARNATRFAVVVPVGDPAADVGLATLDAGLRRPVLHALRPR